MSLLKLPILIVMVLEGLQVGADNQKACSCYTFENGTTQRMTWQEANDSCTSNNEHLLVLESMQEWEFINKTLKDRKAVPHSEWHIGLFKNTTTGNWTWVNGKPLTIDKWQPRKPDTGTVYALIAKEHPLGYYASFNSIKHYVKRAWICEEETDNCQGICMYHKQVTTTSPLSRTTSSIAESPTTYHHTDFSESTYSTIRASAPSKRAVTGDKNDSTAVIVAVSLGALLCLALIALGVILFMRRKKRRGKDTERQEKLSSKQPEDQYDSINSVEAAKLLGTPDTNNARASTKQEPPKVECEYAMVNKANKEPKKGDLVYAQLADFDDTKNEVKAHKPATYEPTVYADVVPTDVFHETGPDSSEPTYANVQSTGV